MITVLSFLSFIIFLLILDIFSQQRETRKYVQRIVDNRRMLEDKLQRENDIREKRLNRLAEVLSQANPIAASKDTFGNIAFYALFDSYSWTTKEEWIYSLITQYPCNVVKEYGRDLNQVTSELSWLWSSYYKDKIGLEYKYSEWAKMFNTKPAVQLYLQMLYDKNIKDDKLMNLVSDRQMNIFNHDDE